MNYSIRDDHNHAKRHEFTLRDGQIIYTQTVNDRITGGPQPIDSSFGYYNYCPEQLKTKGVK